MLNGAVVRLKRKWIGPYFIYSPHAPNDSDDDQLPTTPTNLLLVFK